eukprot:tig00000145_g8815.t1
MAFLYAMPALRARETVERVADRGVPSVCRLERIRRRWTGSAVLGTLLSKRTIHTAAPRSAPAPSGCSASARPSGSKSALPLDEEELIREGATDFWMSRAFYRPLNRLSRDLGVLCVAAHKKERGGGDLRVLDLMAGSGIRGLRYVKEAGATSLTSNEGNCEHFPNLIRNLAPLAGAPEELWSALAARPPREHEGADLQLGPTVRATSANATKLLMRCHLEGDLFDVVDVDAFGCPGEFFSTAPYAVRLSLSPNRASLGLALARFGGLLYVTSTESRAPAGVNAHDGPRMYASFGRSHGAVNEQGLRMTAGYAMQQAQSRGLGLSPLFSLFLRGTYRIMFRVLPRGAAPWRPDLYGFLAHCLACGTFSVVPWKRLGAVCCPDCAARGETPKRADGGDGIYVSGPMWLGPLHDAGVLDAMLAECSTPAFAETFAGPGSEARRVLLSMRDECDTAACAPEERPEQGGEGGTAGGLQLDPLQRPGWARPGSCSRPVPYYYDVGKIARAGGVCCPPRGYLVEELRARGYQASGTHVDRQAGLKTDAPMSVLAEIAASYPGRAPSNSSSGGAA